MWNQLRPDAFLVMKDPKIRRVLCRYLSVVEGKYAPKFLVAKKLPADYVEGDETRELWKLHDSLIAKYYALEGQIDSGEKELSKTPDMGQSYLGLKLELANRILQRCGFCVRNCGVNRAAGALGWCRVGEEFRVSTAFPHMGEEPELVPSGTVFTIGCNFKCLHCQNWTVSQQLEAGEPYTPKTMAETSERLRGVGCRNLNMVGGEPTPYLHKWLETLNLTHANIATIWNSNAYYSEEAAKLLTGLIDVYLLDFKYGNDGCAEKISSASKYWEACTRNHLAAARYGELIVRVLVLPGHNECCTKPILKWIAENLGTETRVNLMDQYRPEWRADEIPELRRRLTRDEFDEAVQIARNVGLANFMI